mmetsp:Transcript_737/g.2201  ORF Transcript_737/g.2201 Transcript_737/m.2201 type:complete len:232 (+) Transcript_737:606-1301(+)
MRDVPHVSAGGGGWASNGTLQLGHGSVWRGEEDGLASQQLARGGWSAAGCDARGGGRSRHHQYRKQREQQPLAPPPPSAPLVGAGAYPVDRLPQGRPSFVLDRSLALRRLLLNLLLHHLLLLSHSQDNPGLLCPPMTSVRGTIRLDKFLIFIQLPPGAKHSCHPSVEDASWMVFLVLCLGSRAPAPATGRRTRFPSSPARAQHLPHLPCAPRSSRSDGCCQDRSEDPSTAS